MGVVLQGRAKSAKVSDKKLRRYKAIAELVDPKTKTPAKPKLRSKESNVSGSTFTNGGGDEDGSDECSDSDDDDIYAKDNNKDTEEDPIISIIDTLDPNHPLARAYEAWQLRLQGQTYAEISDCLQMPRSTVASWVNKMADHFNCPNPDPTGHGDRRRLSTRQKEEMLNLAIKNPDWPVTRLAKEFGKKLGRPISRDTAKRTLEQQGVRFKTTTTMMFPV